MRRMLMSRCPQKTQAPTTDACAHVAIEQRDRPPAHLEELDSRALAMVDLPEHERPVKKIVPPCCDRGG